MKTKKAEKIAMTVFEHLFPNNKGLGTSFIFKKTVAGPRYKGVINNIEICELVLKAVKEAKKL